MSDEDFLGHTRVEVRGAIELLPMFRSAKMILTHNLDKSQGIVNGAFGVFLNFGGHFAEVQLDTGVIAVVPRIAHERSVWSRGLHAQDVIHEFRKVIYRFHAETPHVAETRVRCAEHLWWYGYPTRQSSTPNT